MLFTPFFPALLAHLAIFDLAHLDILFMCIFVQTLGNPLIQSGHGNGHEASIYLKHIKSL